MISGQRRQRHATLLTRYLQAGKKIARLAVEPVPAPAAPQLDRHANRAALGDITWRRNFVWEGEGFPAIGRIAIGEDRGFEGGDAWGAIAASRVQPLDGGFRLKRRFRSWPKTECRRADRG